MNNGSILAGNSHVQRLDWESAWASRFVVTSAVPSAQHGEISAEMLLQGSRFFEMPAAILTILILFCNAIALIFLVAKYHSGYWKRRNVPTVSGGIPFLGHIPYQAATTYGMFVALVDSYGQWTRQLGKFFGYQEGWNNVLVISDPALVEQVYNKHFECFHIRRELGAHIFNRDAGKNLLGLNGPEWKQQRASALHAFSRKELREKILPMIHCSVVSVLNSVRHQADLLNVLSDCTWHLMARLALHSVVSTHDSASGGDESAGTAEACGEEMELKYGGKMEEWAAMAKQFERGNIDTLTDRHNGILYSTVYVLCMCVPWLSYKLQPIVNKYLLAKERAEEKAPFRALCHYIEMDLFGCKECEKMQQLNAPVSKMDLAELLYQDVVLSNGFRSIDNTLYRICVQLALNPAVQTKLRAEIEMTNEKPGFNQITELAYLDAVIRETLRIEPLEAQYNAVMDRICTRDCTLHASDGQQLCIEAGTWVKADVYSLHKDTSLFGTDADQFNPERWLDISTAQNCRQRATVLSFGAGPRVCIAQRLNMLQLKATLIPFLRRFYINYDRAMSSPTLVGIAEQVENNNGFPFATTIMSPLVPRSQRLPVAYEACASFKVYCGMQAPSYSSSSSLSKKKENSGFLVVVFGYVTCFIAVGSAVGAVVGGIIGAIKGTSAKKVRTKEMQVVMNAIGFPECPDCKKKEKGICENSGKCARCCPCYQCKWAK